jgi:hypothetical protein
MANVPPFPRRIGPAGFGVLTRWVMVCRPRDLVPLMRRAGCGSRVGGGRWIEPRRIGPVIKALRRDTDPLATPL